MSPTELLVIFLRPNLSILSRLSNPDPNANGVVVHVSVEGVDIFPLIFGPIAISNDNNKVLIPL
jgi:hypothetical protein